ncbi:hypothetical protein HMPREF1549_00749 [Actinomyces johnsonii F0510]|uniref:Uncharacterized protein n=1 Tax=Actinomyces johnsonii F0510 TaxID=1227262 RepID=U1QGK3_9ACTO|nr:hypothetical protein HMPREF1549_00749 [Actinomyces johnsonii F0510]
MRAFQRRRAQRLRNHMGGGKTGDSLPPPICALRPRSPRCSR